MRVPRLSLDHARRRYRCERRCGLEIDAFQSGLTPTREDLRALRAEAIALRELVVSKELELAALEASVSDFTAKRECVVARLYAELDDVDAQIAEALLRRRPYDAVLAQRASDARARAERSAGETQGRARDQAPPRTEPTPELQALYYKAARQFHPDLGRENDQAVRHEFMVLLNAAYERHDRDAIISLVEDWNNSVVTLPEESPSSEAARLLWTIARLRNTLPELAQKIARLQASPVNLLLLQSEEARRQGRDLIDGIVSDLRRRIEDARSRLQALMRRSGP